MQVIQTTADGKTKLLVAGLSDVGCVRQNNEDSYGIFYANDLERGCLMIVADGMGGAAGGEIASRVAVETVRDSYYESANGNRGTALLESIQRANRAIFDRAEQDTQLAGMGTTCTAAVISDLELIIGHVGDSRAYLIRNDEFVQITHDHSLAAELERRAAPGDPMPLAGRNVLTRCLGVAPEVRVDMTDAPIPLTVDTRIVICTDGLSNMVTADEIFDIVVGNPPDVACKELVALARERGGPDNITVQVACVTAS